MAERVDAVVIGAGVVGLAIARALALAGREVLVLEAEDAIGTGVSSRNSEVIHAGLYYPKDSLRARVCVRGKHLLYDFCRTRGVAHRQCGKLIVATSPEEAEKLDGIAASAAANGVPDLRRLGHNEIRAMEPELGVTDALLSPSTGIVDSHGLMLALQGEAEAHGAMVVLRAPVVRGAAANGRILLETGGPDPATLEARTVVNSAGLFAQEVARSIKGVPQALVPTRHIARGCYFSLTGKSPFSRLVYPVPVPGGLGTHLTIDLGGQARFGPDVEWIDTIDYTVNPARAESFYAAIRRYWPGLQDGALKPDYAGVRPKLSGPGEPARDFMVQGPKEHGVPGLVNLFGIESPGLTSSLALAELVAEIAA
ncbi:MAG: NAD(P)/FAD-dependent oxidoreductase [Hyphomicrobiales bacterium]